MKVVLGFISGLAIGAAGAYIFVKDHYDSMLKDEIEENLRLEEEMENLKNSGQELPKMEKNEEKMPEKRENLAKNDEISEKMGYNTMFKGKKAEENVKKIELIEADEYYGETAYEKHMMSYFEEDDVLVDHDGENGSEIITDIAGTIGIDNLDQLSYQDGEIFVRNDNLGIVYNVVLEAGSYEDYVE